MGFCVLVDAFVYKKTYKSSNTLIVLGIANSAYPLGLPTSSIFSSL